jgi:hypothetical protein
MKAALRRFPTRPLAAGGWQGSGRSSSTADARKSRTADARAGVQRPRAAQECVSMLPARSVRMNVSATGRTLKWTVPACLVALDGPSKKSRTGSCSRATRPSRCPSESRRWPSSGENERRLCFHTSREQYRTNHHRSRLLAPRQNKPLLVFKRLQTRESQTASCNSNADCEE